MLRSLGRSSDEPRPDRLPDNGYASTRCDPDRGAVAMAGWILGVQKEHADNWRIGRDSGRWAIAQFRDIRAGDELFFWLSGSGIIAHGQAVTDATKPEDYEALPWPDRYRLNPEGRPVQRYSHWFGMRVLKELAEARNQKWSDMGLELGFRAQGNSMPVKIPPGSDVIALSWFEPGERVLELGDGEYPSVRLELANPQTIDFNDLPTDTHIAMSNEPVVLDPDVRGDALNRHNGAVNLLAAAVRDNGWQPVSLTSWFSEKPDLAWFNGRGVFNVAEVKGLNLNNELSQLRVGLGQVVRYRHRAAMSYGQVQAWLVADSPPLDPLWDAVCASVQVYLWWPGRPWPDDE